MIEKLFHNKKAIIILSIIFVIIIIISYYTIVLSPKIEIIALKESELSMQQQLLEVVENKQMTTDGEYGQNPLSLQKLVPVQPMTQQLVLAIEKAEVISGSFVTNMFFDDSGTTEDLLQEEIDAETEHGEDEKEISKAIPKGVMRLTATLDVESPTYFEFEKFLDILENSERITVIDAIDFSVKEEIIEEGEEKDPLRYQVILSVFYMPTLTDLIESLPKIDTPPPANKKDPFPRFGDVF